ncbi:hypothetical protein Kpol_1050p19 [Vanderwaltozyma polyspora DSM 70294]|uniref:C2H2-type domain-containing protein n=1 Tax=Vanderwaltozyma polyspora (strain ATCC 22028 / DSM 70294 / BCRC 21397 / CBS 2163 / NBRC 10782 / NRRL Y-8283 / UCD 57-17) TaxID=436907 RepID=A7TER6_VANPO|nr:uncharacterized protein Kpol_1050p19 [Vanderwaltozyma polyspora DSM 70294]EDO19162.1 hypothetical protein Kpol_1050p19 [Vanderwaltozyma polyspora DSM 70294]
MARTTIRSKLPKDNFERPYLCEVCNRGFYRLEHKKRHLKIHTGEKPYKCLYLNCSKKFSRSDELNRHSKVHHSRANGSIKRKKSISPSNPLLSSQQSMFSANQYITSIPLTPVASYQDLRSPQLLTFQLQSQSQLTPNHLPSLAQSNSNSNNQIASMSSQTSLSIATALTSLKKHNKSQPIFTISDDEQDSHSNLGMNKNNSFLPSFNSMLQQIEIYNSSR